MAALRDRYIEAGFIKPCPYRNRKPLTFEQLAEQGYWSALKAGIKRVLEGGQVING